MSGLVVQETRTVFELPLHKRPSLVSPCILLHLVAISACHAFQSYCRHEPRLRNPGWSGSPGYESRITVLPSRRDCHCQDLNAVTVKKHKPERVPLSPYSILKKQRSQCHSPTAVPFVFRPGALPCADLKIRSERKVELHLRARRCVTARRLCD